MSETLQPIVVQNFEPKKGEEFFYQLYCEEKMKHQPKDLESMCNKITGLKEWQEKRKYATFYNNDRLLHCNWQYKNAVEPSQKEYYRRMIGIFEKSFRGIENHPYRQVFDSLVKKEYERKC